MHFLTSTGLVTVSRANPVPVAVVTTDAEGNPVSGGVPAVAGNFGPSGGITPAFRPIVGRGVGVSLSGTFGGLVVTTEVSRDSGASWRPMTVGGSAWAVFAGPADEDVAEAQDATTRYRLVGSGATGSTAVSYRLGH